ncbi:MAG: hypothetical protein ABMA64_31375 [Myxococcota bacterium]
MLWTIAWVGCHKAGPEPEVAPEPSEAPAPVDAAEPVAAEVPASRELLYKAFAVRDGEPVCAEVEALVAEPVPALLDLVRHVSMPPTVPMRAAGCLVERHAAEVPDELEAWVTTDATRGLALLVADRVDLLPTDVAVRVTAAAMAGPHAAELGPRLAASGRAEVRDAARPAGN